MTWSDGRAACRQATQLPWGLQGSFDHKDSESSGAPLRPSRVTDSAAPRMPQLLEIFLLALLAMFFPALLAVVLIALRSSHPQKLLASFLAGGLLAATSVGIAIVFSLQDASVDSSSSSSFDPIVYFVGGVLSLVAAYVVDRKKLLVKDEKKPEERCRREEAGSSDAGARPRCAVRVRCRAYPLRDTGLFRPRGAEGHRAARVLGGGDRRRHHRLLPDHVRLHRGPADRLLRRAGACDEGRRSVSTRGSIATPTGLRSASSPVLACS